MALTADKFEQLIAHSSDIVVATDRKGTVVYYNDGAKASLGYRADEVMGRLVAQLYPNLEEARRVKRAMMSERYGGKGVVDAFQTTFLTKQREQIPVAITGRLLFDEEGNEDGTVGFAKDLRDILHKDQLATLGQVAIGLSHEINNPLSVILNQAELLERDLVRLADEADTSVEMERLDAIRREISRISEILEHLGEMVERDSFETVDYIGPAKMIDLRKRWEGKTDERLRSLRILVVDDDPGILRTLSEILRADGCKVETAGDGRDALDRVAATPFDVVVSDVVMPNMDGYELYTSLHRSHPDLPVLMMTAFTYDKDHIIKRSRMQGLSTVIFKKPVDPERLRRAILAAAFPTDDEDDS
jgi:PAS domain S-box-containing protein